MSGTEAFAIFGLVVAAFSILFSIYVLIKVWIGERRRRKIEALLWSHVRFFDRKR